MILATCLLLTLSCISEQTPYDNDSSTNSDTKSVGYLEFSNLSVSVSLDSEIVSKSDDSIDTDAFIVSIYSVKLEEEFYKSTLAELEGLSEPLTLDVGLYEISIDSIDPDLAPLCDWEAPTYGCTKEVTILSQETTQVDEFVCTLSNIKTSVEFSVDLLELFQDDAVAEEPLNVAVSLGGATLDYSRTEERCGYFKAIEQSNELEIVLSGMYNISSSDEEPSYTKIDEWKQIISGVTAGQWRKISLRVENANDGNVTIEITVETWVYDQTIDVDIQTVSYSYTLVEESIYDPDSETTELNSPVVTLANDHDIEDPFMITSSIFDFDAESCSDIIKAYITPTSGSSVASIDLTVSSTNTSLTAALEAAGFEAGAIAAWPTNAIESYSTIKEESGVVVATVKSSTMFALYDYTGLHTVKILAIDSEGRRSYTYLTINCSKSSSAVDDGNGPTVVWDGYDFDTTYDITSTSYPSVLLNITSPGGITEFYVSIDSEVLTEADLQSMNLDTQMDLINPATDKMSDALVELGFPVEDDIEGATELVLDITEFMPMLAMLGEGATTFELVIKDDLGTTVRQIKLNSLSN